MAGTFKFELVSPERVLLSEDAEQVVVPGRDGDFGVLAGHAPVISTLRPGRARHHAAVRQTSRVRQGSASPMSTRSRLTVLAQSALDLDGLDAGTVAKEIEAAEAEVAAARDDMSRMHAAELVEQLRALQR